MEEQEQSEQPERQIGSTYARNKKYFSEEENHNDFMKIYRAIEEALDKGAGGPVVSTSVEAELVFFDKLDNLWDNRLERVIKKKSWGY